MNELLSSWTHWHWWILAGVLIGTEMIAPGVFFLWMGIAATLTGLVVLVFPGLSWELATLLFSVLSVAAVVFGRMYWKHSQEGGVTDQPFLNRRGTQYVDRVFTLEHAIVNGVGKINADDTVWKVRGKMMDLAAGQRVRVTRVDGTWLEVESVEPGPAARS